MPIVYDVDRIRDGSSFTTRRVVAIQAGRPIFNLSASFQLDEPGLTHQDEMPEAPPPESCSTEQERYAKFAHRLPEALRARVTAERPFELRLTDPDDDPFAPAARPPQRMIWLKATSRLPDEPALHRYLLAYVSDFSFMTTSLMPHGITWITPGFQLASIDHVMWFHRPFRVDDWLLHVVESPSASGSRGLVRGRVFSRAGALVASTAQEGLVRKR
jgi:acyl-CoA thioesterase-2